MKTSNSLVVALILSVVTMSGLMAYQLFGQSNVLGETIEKEAISQKTLQTVEMDRIAPTQASIRETQPGFCGDLNRIVNQYCSSVVILPSTSPAVILPNTAPVVQVTATLRKPTPTLVCKTGLNSYSVGDTCKKSGNTFLSARYTCYDGVSGVVRSPSGECASSTQLNIMAMNACAGHSSCQNATSAPAVKR